jgi:hypothetical protein
MRNDLKYKRKILDRRYSILFGVHENVTQPRFYVTVTVANIGPSSLAYTLP